MLNTEEFLTVASFVKWLHNEAMSKEDLSRIISVFENNRLDVSSIDQETATAIQVRLRQVMHNKFSGGKT